MKSGFPPLIGSPWASADGFRRSLQRDFFVMHPVPDRRGFSPCGQLASQPPSGNAKPQLGVTSE